MSMIAYIGKGCSADVPQVKAPSHIGNSTLQDKRPRACYQPLPSHTYGCSLRRPGRRRARNNIDLH